MNIRYAIASSAVALLLSTGPSLAGPCTKALADAQAAYDARLDQAAAAGPTATESTSATLHHQPTPNSVAQAEVRVGDISPARAQAFSDAMARGSAADEAGDRKTCEAALAEADRALRE